MEVSKFAEEELRRTEAIKRDKTLQAMIRTRDMQIQRRKLLRWRCLGMALITLTVILLIYL